jgi:2-amino-4,5-dihydroxy-6-oxo-7-(phosphonooxy)heptanoate synthase
MAVHCRHQSEEDVGPHNTFTRSLRMLRLRRRPGGLFIVPLDHSVTAGPVAPDGDLDRLVSQFAANGVDAVVLHKGAVRRVNPLRFANLSLIVHLSAGTARAPDPDARCLVASVEEALQLGADAVSVHVNLGSLEEQRQLADLAAVAGECDRWGLPLLAMVYPRGPKVTDPADAELVAHAAAVAADLGADLVKVPQVPDPAKLRDVVRACPIPLIVAGGPQRSLDDLRDTTREAMRAGVAGAAIGRNVFESASPGQVARDLADLIHDTASGGMR